MLGIRVTQDAETKAILERIATSLERIELWLRPEMSAPSQVMFLRREQIAMSQFMDYVGFGPPSNPSDVAGRELKTLVHGTETVTPYAGDAVESNAIGPLDAGDEVSLSLRDIDAAGNKSPWSSPLTYTVVDNVAPATPDAPFMVRREQLPDAAEDPTV